MTFSPDTGVGDLNLTDDNGFVVAVLYHRERQGIFAVYDVMRGGHPTFHSTLPAAITAMKEIANAPRQS